MNEILINNLQQLSKDQLVNMIIQQNNQIDQLSNMVKDLQLQMNKDSSNSSKPPSSDNFEPKKNQSLRQKSGKKSGGQKGHQGTTRKQKEKPDKIISCRPNNCEQCGKDLDNMEGEIVGKRQEVDIPPIKPITTEYQQEKIKCACGHCNQGKFPEHIKAAFQLGQNLQSFIVYLNTAHYIPYQRLAQILDDMLNMEISQGTIDNVLDNFNRKSQPYYYQILDDIKRHKWTGGDETGAKVNGKKWWYWVWQNTKGSFYIADKSRGYAVVEKYFGTNYLGILIHDCWSAQNNTVAKGHQLCHPHLLRDLIFCMETEKNKWTYNVFKLLLSSEKARDKIWQDDFNPEMRNKIIQNYQDKLQQLIRQKLTGAISVRLQKRFKKHQEKIFYFMNDPDIPWHNNSSEQAIRGFKLHQKISGCFRSIKGAKRRAVILSIVETCKKRKMNILKSLQQIIQGDFAFAEI